MRDSATPHSRRIQGHGQSLAAPSAGTGAEKPLLGEALRKNGIFPHIPQFSDVLERTAHRDRTCFSRRGILVEFADSQAGLVGMLKH